MASDKVENVSFKVSLLENEKSLEKLEVRRFVVPQDCSTSLVYLKEKIRNIFNLGRSDCKVFWIDEDNDHVAIETDEELVIALQELNGPVYKLQVVKRNLVEINSDDNDNSAKNVSGEVHPGVVCDGCDGQVKGFRYVAIFSLIHDEMLYHLLIHDSITGTNVWSVPTMTCAEPARPRTSILATT